MVTHQVITRRFFVMGTLLAGTLALTSNLKAKPAQRIVSLTSLTADIVYRLSSTALVGVPTGSLIEQDPRFADIQSIGLGNGPNLEQIVALKPDLVIGAAGFHHTVAEQLETLGFTTLLTQVNSWPALTTTTEQIGAAMGLSVEQLVREYSVFKPTPVGSDLKVLLLVGQQPILSPNKNSWAGDLLNQYGVQNVTAILQSQGQFRGYVTLSAEKIVELDPDILLVVNPEDSDPLNFFQSRSYWNQLSAVQAKHVYAFNYYGLVNPGSVEKIVEACIQLDEILKPHSP